MKAKDIQAHMPGYFLTRDSYRPKVVFISESEQVENWSGSWCQRKNVSFHTKYHTVTVKLSADGTCLQMEDGGWYDKVMANRIAGTFTEKQALDRLQNERRASDHSDYRQAMYDENADKLIAALVAAGFPEAVDAWKGVTISVGDVVKWCEEQGLTCSIKKEV